MSLTGEPEAADPRLRPVEDNLFDYFRAVGLSLLEAHAESDVFWFTSDVALALMNGALGARFAPESASRRTHEVLDRLIGHGNPFMWWLTPSTRSPEMENALLERRLLASTPSIGMHLDLHPALPALTEPLPAGVTVHLAGGANLDRAARVVMAVFGLPEAGFDGMRVFMSLEQGPVRVTSVLAQLDGAPVGAGTVVVSGGAAGLYNIAVDAEARCRGVGGAITAALMRLGADQSCREAILYATPVGLPVYAKVGFAPVCEMAQYVWQSSG